MSALQPFCPSYGNGKTVSAGAAALSTSIVKDALSVAITNTGSNIAYVKIGNSGIAASTADFPVLASNQVVLTKGFGQDVISYISASGTTLHIITGEGW